MRLTAVAFAALAFAGCGQLAAQPGAARRATAYRARGLAVSLPPGWGAAAESLTPNLVAPREVLAVATYPLRYRDSACNHLPGSALEDLGAAGALVTLYERDRPGADVPPRPARFGPGLGGPSEASACAPGARFRDHWFEFADHGRAFHVLVAFGPDASAQTQAQTWAILDGLQVEPATISIGRPVTGEPYELEAPPLRSSPGYRALVVPTDAPDRCVATVPVGQRLREANRACNTGDAALFVARYGVPARLGKPVTVVAGIAPPDAVRVDLGAHRLPLSAHRAFLALVAGGRPPVTVTTATGETRRLTTRRRRRPGAVFDDEIGENVLLRTRAQMVARFGPPAATEGACDYYALVGDTRRRGWRFCYRAGGAMTGASGSQRLP
jgi:hypothetical protein